MEELEGSPMLAGEDFDSEAELLPRAEERRPRPAPRRAAVVTAVLLGATAVLAVVSGSAGRAASADLLARVPGGAELVSLDAIDSDPCGHMPSLRIMSIKSNNLGGKGPDKGVPEGLIYHAKSTHAGLNGSDVEIQLHVVSESYFTHGNKEGTNTSAPSYDPEWPKVNGITGHFGTINVHAGTNVTCKLKGYDANTGKDIELPKWAITFFDLDTGKDGNKSVEFLRVNNFKEYFVSNETELEVRSNPDGSTTFTGTVEGDGDDNPDNPLKLTTLQKNRAVSFVFEDTKEVVFELGASPGSTARVFQFVVRPILRCAFTKLANGTLIAADDPNSPILAKRGGTEHSRPAAMVLGLLLLAVQRWF